MLPLSLLDQHFGTKVRCAGVVAAHVGTEVRCAGVAAAHVGTEVRFGLGPTTAPETFGLVPTPLVDGLRAHVGFWRERPAA